MRKITQNSISFSHLRSKNHKSCPLNPTHQGLVTKVHSNFPLIFNFNISKIFSFSKKFQMILLQFLFSCWCNVLSVFEALQMCLKVPSKVHKEEIERSVNVLM
jgi:hypothetical protein